MILSCSRRQLLVSADLVAMGQQSGRAGAGGDGKQQPALEGLLRDYRCTKPMIAAVEGYAVAGGTEMLQGTDIRIAGEGAIFGVWEAKRGLFPLGGSSCRLPRQIPYTVAMDILLTCRPILRSEAQQMGLIGRTSLPTARALIARRRRHGRSQRATLCPGDLEGGGEDRAHERLRRDASPGPDRLGGVRQRRRQGGPAGVRREAPTEYQGK